jgi:hypothetical protein
MLTYFWRQGLKLYFLFFLAFLICERIVAGEPDVNRYKPQVHFYVSDTQGGDFNESIKDIAAGQKFLLKVEVKIKTNFLTSFLRGTGPNSLNRIKVTVTIPNTEILDFFDLIQGPSAVTPVEDPINGIRAWQFLAFADMDPNSVNVIFQCQAKSPGQQTFSVTFGPQVNSVYALFRTIVYL